MQAKNNEIDLSEHAGFLAEAGWYICDDLTDDEAHLVLGHEDWRAYFDGHAHYELLIDIPRHVTLQSALALYGNNAVTLACKDAGLPGAMRLALGKPEDWFETTEDGDMRIRTHLVADGACGTQVVQPTHDNVHSYIAAVAWRAALQHVVAHSGILRGDGQGDGYGYGYGNGHGDGDGYDT